MYGGPSNDGLRGGSGRDVVKGDTGNDTVTGGAGLDQLFGGGDEDKLLARDGNKDRVNCGAGKDLAVVDKKDRVSRNCETVRRP